MVFLKKDPLTEKNKMQSRERICWNDLHMLEALIAAQRSPDPNTQVGSCIVTPENRVISSGYNSFPNNIGISRFSWKRKAENPLDTKYPFVVHSEINAIHNAISSTKESSIYVTMHPCNECAKSIIQAGIKKVYYLTDPYEDSSQTKASKLLLNAAFIETEHFKWQNKNIVLASLNLISANISQTRV